MRSSNHKKEQELNNDKHSDKQDDKVKQDEKMKNYVNINDVALRYKYNLLKGENLIDQYKKYLEDVKVKKEELVLDASTSKWILKKI